MQTLEKTTYSDYFSIVNPQYIEWDFYKSYLDKEPPFGEIGLLVAVRTYNRFIEELGRREKWCETILRNIEYSLSLDVVSSLTSKKEEAKKLFDMMFNLRGFPSGRSLWTAGTKQTLKDGSSGWNCTFKAINCLSAFSEIFYWLLIGAGTGFSVEDKYVSQLPKLNPHVTITHKVYDPVPASMREEVTELTWDYGYLYLTKEDLISNDFDFYNKLTKVNSAKVTIKVGDSKESWCNSLRAYLHLLTLPVVEIIEFVYDNVRPEGERIKTFGGRASGPKALVDLFNNIDKIIKRCKGIIDSVAALDINNCIGLNVVSGGVRRCLPKGTLIHLQNGLTPIEEVKVGDLVATSKGYHKVTDWVYQGIQGISQVKTQAGIFECTDKHKVAIISDTKGSYTWKKANELVPGDRMVFVKNVIPGTNTELPSYTYTLPKNSSTCTDITIPKMNEDLAYMLGFFHGDGYVKLDSGSGEISFAISANQEEVLQRLQKTLSLFNVNSFIQLPTTKDNCYKLRVKSKQLAEYLYQFKKPNTSIKIPTIILQGLDSYRASYIAGVFDADGCTRNRPLTVATSIYPSFVKELQVLLSSLGILTTFKLRREAKGNWKSLYDLSLKGEVFINKFASEVGTYSQKYSETRTSNRSQNDYGYPTRLVIEDKLKYEDLWSKTQKQMTVATLERITQKEVTLIPVEVIEIIHNTRLDETYDISVDSVHEFVADTGFLVHNTAEIGLGSVEDIAFIEAKLNLYTDPDKEEYRAIRSMSNNSVLLYKNPGLDKIKEIMESIKSNGEPGFWIIGNSQKLAESPVAGTNPCAEAALDNDQSCNLTTINQVSYVYWNEATQQYEYDWELAKQDIELITRIGSRQTCATQWHPIWDSTQKRDRLLGVSMTGVQDAFDLLNWTTEQKQYLYQWTKAVSIAEANSYHDFMGVNRSTRVTLMKPEGTISQLPTVSSGIHRAYSPYYYRRIRFSKTDPLAKALLEAGLQAVPENNQGEDLFANKCTTWVFTFPVSTNTTIRAIDEDAISQLESYKLAQVNYADRGHNISATITLNYDEYDKAANWINDNWDDIIGVSFLPRFDPVEGGSAAYPLMPYEPTDKEGYEKLKATIPYFKEDELITLLTKYESSYEEKELNGECTTGCPIR